MNKEKTSDFTKIRKFEKIDKLVDDFDNEEWYWKCGFYPVQAIMRMYGKEN